MALPVTIPNTFANATSSIPLSQLDTNFNTLSNAINGINSGAETLANLTASNVTITGGTISNVTLDNVTVTTESFDNITLSNVTITSGNATVTDLTASNVVITGGTFTGITAANIAGANISSGNVTVTVVSLANGNAASPSLRFTDDTDTGVYLSAANAISFTEGGTGYRMGYRNIPDGGPQNTSYTLATSDVGKYVQITSGGSITIPDGTFANGDAISMFNNTNAAVTITCSISTAYIAGTDTDKANVSLATRGVATVLFANANVCVITGNVS
jgi:uncharacterized protein YjbI with pentapeptide repeats